MCGFPGLIQRDDGSMEEALGELRRSRPKPPVGGDFTLSDCFYFYRRGIEDIVEDEVSPQTRIRLMPNSKCTPNARYSMMDPDRSEPYSNA